MCLFGGYSTRRHQRSYNQSSHPFRNLRLSSALIVASLSSWRLRQRRGNDIPLLLPRTTCCCFAILGNTDKIHVLNEVGFQCTHCLSFLCIAKLLTCVSRSYLHIFSCTKQLLIALEWDAVGEIRNFSATYKKDGAFPTGKPFMDTNKESW